MVHSQTNALVAPTFNESYFHLHDYLYTEGETVASRNGTTKEILNFKTQLTEPYKRCVAGYNRNINIFFLLAEAMWIWVGRKDLKFLEIFNSGMKAFSDDGVVFHAPYGYRLRHWGYSSNAESHEMEKDQIAIAIQMLASNSEDRRVVLSVWNPDLDLATKSLDLPCNDLLMFKIRKGKLHQTIQNRSNDLNLGLPTNVFQFSFIGEMMSEILGIEYGTQTHNSQSLHLYMQHEMTTLLQTEFLTLGPQLFERFKRQEIIADTLYDKFEPVRFKLNFPKSAQGVEDKLFCLDFQLNALIKNLLFAYDNSHSADNIQYGEFIETIHNFCPALYYAYALLAIYIEYKRDKNQVAALNNIVDAANATPGAKSLDITVLALNFFLQRIRLKDKKLYHYYLSCVEEEFPLCKGFNIGKL